MLVLLWLRVSGRWGAIRLVGVSVLLATVLVASRQARAEDSLLGRKIVVLKLDALGMDVERVVVYSVVSEAVEGT